MKVVGVDLGGTKLAAALVVEGRLSGTVNMPTDCAHGGEGVLLQIAQACRRVAFNNGMVMEEIDAVGVATPGWVDERRGVILSSANLPTAQLAVADGLSAQLDGRPVRVENDANCAALGEQVYGAARGERDALVITVGTGIGSGVICRGALLTGPGVAELGHTLLLLGGTLCGCGRRGCCEAYCSASALMRMGKEALAAHPHSSLAQGAIKGETIFACAREGDETARRVLEQYFYYFSEMLMNFVNMLRPHVILIGGGVANAGNDFFVPLRKRFTMVARANTYGVELPSILPAALGNAAGILGAAALFTKEK
ncbi:MAG: ROK family protein [Oscillospiraceae bacterium]